MFLKAIDAPARWQWEPDSTASPKPDPGNAPWNCGPTVVAKILSYYKDRAYNVNGIRRSAGVADLRPTNVNDQRVMLERGGVPCVVAGLTIDVLTTIVAGGKRPVLAGAYMGRIPAAVRGHDFTGAHALCIMENATKGGVKGKIYMDPNFSPRTGRTDPTNGRRWISDAQLAYAMNHPDVQRWCVVPNASKNTESASRAVKFNSGVNGVNLRTTPDSGKANVYAVAYADPKGIVRLHDNKKVGNTGSRRLLYGQVVGPDKHRYNRLNINGMGKTLYVQSRFMHEVPL